MPHLLLHRGERGKKREKKTQPTTQQPLKFKVHEHWKDPEIGNSTHREVGKTKLKPITWNLFLFSFIGAYILIVQLHHFS